MRLPNRKPGKFAQAEFDPHITEEKYDQILAELEKLTKRRPLVANKVSEYAQMGDFSENAEYQAAKRQLRGINSRILILQNQLDRAVVINKKNTDIVSIGAKVKVNVNSEEKIYQILGSAETDPSQGIISQSSPIGAALLGHKVGEKVKVFIGGDEKEFGILDISF